MDVCHEQLDAVGRPVIKRCPELAKKIDFRKGSALDTLDALIANGESGTFDFAFIDADKPNYTNYYKRCMQLLRPGGVILVDNALWSGRVCTEDKHPSTVAIDECNRFISEDPNSLNMLLNVGDGAHLAFKTRD
uniref:Caffeoyl-CoA O-methyltransferase n=1 Tax=Steinernema glaseri TaxID=37863 RepID=A0A1I7Z2N4_9BILA